MRKKIVKLLFLIVTIIYIILGALLFINIQVMEAPEIIIDIEVSEISPEEAVLHTIIEIDNPNNFEIVVKNLEIETTTSEGYKVAHVVIEGGDIPSHEKKAFTKDVIVKFEGHSPELLTSKITGDVGMNVLFIQKTIPLKIGIVTSIEKLINEFAAPSISVTVEFDEATPDGINLSAIINAYNPNSFEIYIEDLSGEILTDTGKKVGHLDVNGGLLPAKGSMEINGTGGILFEALNAEKLFFNIDGVAGARIAGFEKNLSFNIETRLLVPNLEELLLSKDNPTLLKIKAKSKLTLKGLLVDILLEINNTYNIDLTVRDIICRIYLVTDDVTNLMGENAIEDELIAESGQTGLLSCEIIIPFTKIITYYPTSDWLMVSVTGRFTMKDIDPAIYVEIEGYTDLHFFT